MSEDHEETDAGSTPMESRGPKHGGRRMSGRALTFDLQSELEKLRGRPVYDKGVPSGTTLVKEADLRIVLMALKMGASLQKHSASGPISIQGIHGVLHVHLQDQEFELTPGQLMSVESGIQHDVVAIEDAAFLLTIGRTTYERVSDSHEPQT